MLVAGADVLELDADRLTEARGLFGSDTMVIRQAQWAINERDANTALFEGFPDGGFVGELAFVDVATGGEPEAQAFVAVKQDAVFVHDEDGDGELANESRVGCERGVRRRDAQTWRTMTSASAKATTAMTIHAGSPEYRQSAAPASTPTLSPATPIKASCLRPPNRVFLVPFI